MALMKPKERDFQIDVNRLDEEWIRQPDLALAQQKLASGCLFFYL